MVVVMCCLGRSADQLELRAGGLDWARARRDDLGLKLDEAVLPVRPPPPFKISGLKSVAPRQKNNAK